MDQIMDFGEGAPDMIAFRTALSADKAAYKRYTAVEKAVAAGLVTEAELTPTKDAWQTARAARLVAKETVSTRLHNEAMARVRGRAAGAGANAMQTAGANAAPTVGGWPDATPSDFQARAAAATVQACCADLKLAANPKIRWFGDEERAANRNRLGYCGLRGDDLEIGFMGGLPLSTVVETAAHETMHAACRAGRFDYGDAEETIAGNYGRQVAAATRLRFADGRAYLVA